MQKIINKNKSIISRELKRNTIYGYYSPNRAHKKYTKRKNHCHMFSMLKYKSFIELFLSKFNKRLFGIEATINYIKKHYSCGLISSSGQAFRRIKDKIWVVIKIRLLKR